jgi:prepilin-type N-terminal cleavage/methylation domain-containing protein
MEATMNVSRTPRRVTGFTMIELLVVILILSILMALGLPLYLAAVRHSERKACRANLKTIANAVQAARVLARAADYSAFIGQPCGPPNLKDLQTVPICTEAGTYSIQVGSTGTAATYKVDCTIHGSFEPGVDSN